MWTKNKTNKDEDEVEDEDEKEVENSFTVHHSYWHHKLKVD